MNNINEQIIEDLMQKQLGYIAYEPNYYED